MLTMTQAEIRTMRPLIHCIFIYLILFLPGCQKNNSLPSGYESVPSPDGLRWNKLYFLDKDNGFAVGGKRFDQAALMITRDGGETWEFREFPEIGKGFYGISGQGDQVYICGFDGKLLISKDRGYHWGLIQVSPWDPLKDLYRLPDSGFLLISGISFNHGSILYLDRYGNTRRLDSLSYEINDLEMTNSQTGYIAGYGVVLRTRDGGNSWDLLPIKNDHFMDLHIQGETIWVCGYQGSIYQSTDEGETWEKKRSAHSLTNLKQRLLSIYFTDEQQGWACGENGTLLRTKDGGNHWEELSPFTRSALRDIIQAPGGDLFLVGDQGAFYRLRDP